MRPTSSVDLIPVESEKTNDWKLPSRESKKIYFSGKAQCDFLYIFFYFWFQFNPIVKEDSDTKPRDYSLATKKKSKNRLQDDGLQHIVDQGKDKTCPKMNTVRIRLPTLTNISILVKAAYHP